MNTRKVIIGGLVGGVAFFFLGWLIWGIILLDFMQGNCNQCMARPMEQMLWLPLILANFAWGFLLALVFEWSNTSGWKTGVQKGAIFGLLISLALDLGFYSMTTMYPSFKVMIVDILANTLYLTLAGTIIGWVMSSVKREA